MTLVKEERFEYITKLLEVEGKIWVSQLAEQLNVTPETIRRDMDELEEKRVLTRIHGGAIPFSPLKKEMEFERKLDVNKEAKMKIAEQAAKRISDGDFIAVDIGTTTVHMADMIQDLQNITVVTHSLAATERFNLALEEKRMTGKVIMLGGISNPEQSAVAGAMTLDMLSRMKIDKAFLSCGGVTDSAIYDFDFDEALVSSKMIELSTKTILLADASKIGETSYFSICTSEKIDEVISNRPCPAEWQDAWKKKGIKWTTAG